MPSTLPAMRGKFGSTVYYLTTMRAQELTERLVIPTELDDWEGRTIEERFQRDINYGRVKDHIAPYLAADEDRFFGALIVDMYNPEGIAFEVLDEVISGVPKAYVNCVKAFGFLHLTGAEVLVPLDGQHRLKALEFAISGRDEKNAEIPGLVPNLDVAKDEVTVMLIAHDEQKARKIFNKVNRYAKPTSKAENLITADDDVVAKITRRIADELIGDRLVNYKSNTLGKKSAEFTTLSTLYDSNLRALEFTLDKKIDTTKLLAYSSDFGHPFRSIPAAQSSPFRPPVPAHSGHRRSVATQGFHS